MIAKDDEIYDFSIPQIEMIYGPGIVEKAIRSGKVKVIKTGEKNE